MKKSQLVFIAIIVMLLASVLTVPLTVGAAQCNPIPATTDPSGSLRCSSLGQVHRWAGNSESGAACRSPAESLYGTQRREQHAQ